MKQLIARRVILIAVVIFCAVLAWQTFASYSANANSNRHVTPTCAACGEQTEDVIMFEVDGKPIAVCRADAGELALQD